MGELTAAPCFASCFWIWALVTSSLLRICWSINAAAFTDRFLSLPDRGRLAVKPASWSFFIIPAYLSWVHGDLACKEAWFLFACDWKLLAWLPQESFKGNDWVHTSSIEQKWLLWQYKNQFARSLGYANMACVSEWSLWSTNVSQETTKEQRCKSCDAFNVK